MEIRETGNQSLVVRSSSRGGTSNQAGQPPSVIPAKAGIQIGWVSQRRCQENFLDPRFCWNDGELCLPVFERLVWNPRPHPNPLPCVGEGIISGGATHLDRVDPPNGV